MGPFTMGAEWFYEYDGKKVGPIPDATLRHLARHGAISPQTNVWKTGMDAPVSASRVKNLFANIVEASIVSESSPNETVTQYLIESLEACRDEDQDRLKQHTPALHAMHPFTVSSILLDYEILSVRQLPTPIQDSATPPEKRTKPVRQMFEATVHVVLCQRPNYRTTLHEIRRLQPGRREETIVYECKEFKDGDWLFLDADLTR